MLVLVSRMIEECFGILKHKLESIIAILLLCVPTYCAATPMLDGVDSDSKGAPAETSVLVLREDNELSPAYNPEGVESNNDASESTVIDNESAGNATFTARPMSPAPSPPQDLLIPAGPVESNFTRPFTNELRGESMSQDGANSPPESKSPTELMSPADSSAPVSQDTNQSETENGGVEANGTFATTNQSFQDQFNTGQSGFQPPNQSPPVGQGLGNAPPARPAQFGAGGGPARQSRGNPAPFSAQPPALSSRQSAVPPVSDQPGAWRDAPPAGSDTSGMTGSSLAPMTGRDSSVRSFNTQPGQGVPPPIQSANAQSPSYGGARQAGGQLNSLDPYVRPTGFSQPDPGLTTDLAKMLIARYSANAATGEIPGRPIKLIEMLREPIPVQQRRAMVNQYWETYYDWANYVSAQEYVIWLKRIPAPASAAESALLDASIAHAENATLAAEIQLGKSQAGLAQYMPNWQSSDLLPLPNDLPLIRSYRTNYEEFRSRRMMPVSLRGIDQMLPRTLDLIMKRAEVVKFTKMAADQVLAGRSGLPIALEAGRAKRTAERDLVASVVSYNQAIGDYSLSVTGGHQPPESVVAMLIEQPRTSVAQASSVLSQPSRSQPKTGAPPSGSFGGQNRPQANGGSDRSSTGSSVFNLDAAGAPKASPPVFRGGAQGGPRPGGFSSPENPPANRRFGGGVSNNGFGAQNPSK